jgi:LEA14-like dessication related protein
VNNISSARSLLLALIGTTLAACSAMLPKLEPPHVDLIGVTIEGGNLKAERLGFTLQVMNPNNRSLAVERIDYQLTLSGVDFATGSSAEPFTLAALGQTEVHLDVTADLAKAIQAVLSHLGEPSLDYQVSGHVKLAHNVIPAFPFTAHGHIAIK